MTRMTDIEETRRERTENALGAGAEYKAKEEVMRLRVQQAIRRYGAQDLLEDVCEFIQLGKKAVDIL
jgi:hypothetical protein